MATYVLGGIFLICGGLGTLRDPFHRPSATAGGGTFAHAMPYVYGISTGVLDALTALAARSILDHGVARPGMAAVASARARG